MTRNLWLRIVVAFVLFGLVIALIAVGTRARDTSLELIVQDAVSSAWVWDATITVQDRVIQSYYQSDEHPATLRFTGLRPGAAEVRVTAPAYQPVTVPVTLTRGRNVLEAPIEVVGYQIPDLRRFVIFPIPDDDGFLLEIRLVDSVDRAIVEHPALPIWIGARVSVQESIAGSGFLSQRGAEVYRSGLNWEFDSDPNVIFRYSARIPRDDLRLLPGLTYVMDFLVLTPDPRETDASEITEFMASWETDDSLFSDPEVFRTALRQEGIVAEPFYLTSWDVEIPQ